jgi:hypothetical protein
MAFFLQKLRLTALIASESAEHTPSQPDRGVTVVSSGFVVLWPRLVRSFSPEQEHELGRRPVRAGEETETLKEWKAIHLARKYQVETKFKTLN